MAKKARIKALIESDIDCACVIHGTGYDWVYVEKLHSMLARNFSRDMRLHVFTEADRHVPDPFIKHSLLDWPGINGPRKSWWYKMQMFDPRHHLGRFLYFDLDVVIVDNLDWMLALDPDFLWAVRDFRHLFRGAWHGINSSVMIWDTAKFGYVWQQLIEQNIQIVAKRFQGDQDFLNFHVAQDNRRYLDQDRIKSWRWELKDGGMDFKTRTYLHPSAGTVLKPNTHIMVFHGRPKPHEIQDPVIQQNWC